LLTQDHKNVQRMFKEFEKLKGDDARMNEQKAALVGLACAALTIHAKLEEEIFYPAAREAIEDEDLLDEATVEHASAKELIAQLADMAPGDALYDAKFTVLGEYVDHHVKEEQEELFPKVRKAKLDLEGLGQQLQQRAQHLIAEMGLQQAVGDEDDGRIRTSVGGGPRA
jgi:hemerythrin superfamily protein